VVSGGHKDETVTGATLGVVSLSYKGGTVDGGLGACHEGCAMVNGHGPMSDERHAQCGDKAQHDYQTLGKGRNHDSKNFVEPA
jgi:hypothetical protein